MSDKTHNDLNEPGAADIVDGLLVFITGPVLAATMLPGLTLCVPGIVLFAAPILALAVLAGLLAAIAAVPCLLVGGAARLVRRSRRSRSLTEKVNGVKSTSVNSSTAGGTDDRGDLLAGHRSTA
jgi:membrane protein implicated in regulation of membrane protease activity